MLSFKAFFFLQNAAYLYDDYDSPKMMNTPAIEKVDLDNEISLALASLPVSGPGESMLDFESTNPFKVMDSLA